MPWRKCFARLTGLKQFINAKNTSFKRINEPTKFAKQFCRRFSDNKNSKIRIWNVIYDKPLVSHPATIKTSRIWRSISWKLVSKIILATQRTNISFTFGRTVFSGLQFATLFIRCAISIRTWQGGKFSRDELFICCDWDDSWDFARTSLNSVSIYSSKFARLKGYCSSIK